MRKEMHMGSPEFSALKSRFATTVAPGSGAGLSLAEQRAASEHFGDLATEPDGVGYSDGDADGVRVRDDEILRDDAIRFGAKAITAGVDVTFDIVPEMQHIFIKAVGSMPESDLAVARLGAYLRRAFAADAVQLAGETGPITGAAPSMCAGWPVPRWASVLHSTVWI
jgi:hypothetical protein